MNLYASYITFGWIWLKQARHGRHFWLEMSNFWLDLAKASEAWPSPNPPSEAWPRWGIHVSHPELGLLRPTAA